MVLRARMRLLIVIAGVALALVGCDTESDRTRAEAERLHGVAASRNAEAVRLEREADLAAVQAISSTLSAQSGQIKQLTDTVIESARLWQVVTVSALLFAGALMVLLAIVVVAALRRRAGPAPTTYILPMPPAMPERAPLPLLRSERIEESEAWTVTPEAQEERINMRARRLVAQRREMDARRLLVDGPCRDVSRQIAVRQ